MNANTAFYPIASDAENISIENYSSILDELNCAYDEAGNYWRTGTTKVVQGWLIHVSSVLNQVSEVIKITAPYLIEQNIAFKVVKDKQTCNDILNGYLGYHLVGKVLTIYPEDDRTALILAKEIIVRTRDLKGPDIPTDLNLCGIVYTRYGSFEKIYISTPNGKREPAIYQENGNISLDIETIPFKMPERIQWPFKEIKPSRDQPKNKTLNKICRITSILKTDPKGNVYKGLFLKKGYSIKTCVIKEGKKHMCSDEYGREMFDRLKWQWEIYNDLKGKVPMPEIYDLFEYGGNAYLVMQHINGNSLYGKIAELNPLTTSWTELPVPNRLRLLQYLINIAEILRQIHLNGYVHRDVVPVNFIIDSNDNPVLIDMEISYNYIRNVPWPPHKYGTTGFMSPEQQEVRLPTVKEDIYGLGALILTVITGISPVKLTGLSEPLPVTDIEFFTGSSLISHMATACLRYEASERPAIGEIILTLREYQDQLKLNGVNRTESNPGKDTAGKMTLQQFILKSIDGLNEEPTVIDHGLWCSKKASGQPGINTHNKQYTLYPGIKQGVAGVLYTYAKVAEAGLSVEKHFSAYIRGWEYLNKECLNQMELMAPGLYQGAAGIGLALIAGIKGGLLENDENNRQRIKECIDKKSDNPTIADGFAGQLVTLLKAKSIIDDSYFSSKRSAILEKIIQVQETNSLFKTSGISWARNKSGNLSFSYGATGILWSLLQCALIEPGNDLDILLENCLKWLTKEVKKRRGPAGNVLEDGNKGLTLVLIKAYEYTGNNFFRIAVENALHELPDTVVHNNYSQWNGLSSTGEIYLEAYRVFGNIKWKTRAYWIRDVLMHSSLRNVNGSIYWTSDVSDIATGDFLMGNSGIIHFLVRCLHEKTGYRLLQ